MLKLIKSKHLPQFRSNFRVISAVLIYVVLGHGKAFYECDLIESFNKNKLVSLTTSEKWDPGLSQYFLVFNHNKYKDTNVYSIRETASF